MRRLRVVASAQLPLALGGEEVSVSFWDLPEAAQVEVLGLLGRLIARGVVADEAEGVAGE